MVTPSLPKEEGGSLRGQAPTTHGSMIQFLAPICGLIHKGEGRWDPERPWLHRRSIYDFWLVFYRV